MTGSPPIFLQTGFRSGGTWLWSRFRAIPKVTAYCEPLNEALYDITRTAIDDLSPATSRLNHPSLKDPYFAEFLPLLDEAGNGVRHFRLDFGIQSYFDMSEDVGTSLSVYLNTLLDHAHASERRPVLKFTRALGRSLWLRQVFPQARQILVVRPPLEQFLSGWKLFQTTGNATFLTIPLFVATRLRTGAVQELCERFAIPCIPESDDLGRRIGDCAAIAREMPLSSLWVAFLVMFVVGHSKALQQADMTINTSALAAADKARQAEQKIFELSGLRPDLSNHVQNPHAETCADKRVDLRNVFDIVCAALESDYPEAIDFTRRLNLDVRPV